MPNPSVFISIRSLFFAEGERKCVKGTTCGNSCISTKKECDNPLGETGKKGAEWLKKHGASATDRTEFAPSPLGVAKPANRKVSPSTAKPVNAVVPAPKKKQGQTEAQRNAQTLIDTGTETFDAFARDLEIAEETSRQAIEELDVKVKSSHASFKQALASGDQKAAEKHREEGMRAQTQRRAYRDAIVEERTKIMQSFRDSLLEKAMTKEEALETTRKTAFYEGADRDFPDGYTMGDMQNDFTEFHQLTGGRVNSIDHVWHWPGNDRAFASNEKRLINTGSAKVMRKDAAAMRATIFHEAAHHIEFGEPKVKDAVRAWMEGKATSTKPKKLSEITGNNAYGDKEIAYEDSYYSPYIGKVYPGGETEVLSVGLENFSDPTRMAALYKKDPEHFKLIAGIVSKMSSKPRRKKTNG